MDKQNMPMPEEQKEGEGQMAAPEAPAENEEAAA